MFNYDDIADDRYNPHKPAGQRESPKAIGYGSNPTEKYTIDSKGQISLYEYIKELNPTKTYAKDLTTGEVLSETPSSNPSKNQFCPCYDERGNGIVQFHSSRIGHTVEMKYYGTGTRPQRSTLKFSILGSGYTKVVASSDSATGSQEIADEIILTTEDAGAKIKSLCAQLNAIGGGKIKILEGTYSCKTGITMSDFVDIDGSGYGTVLKRAGNNTYIIEMNPFCKVSNLRIDGNKSLYTGAGISNIFYTSHIDNVWVHDCNSSNFQICYNVSSCYSWNSNSLGFNGSKMITNCYSYNNSSDGFYDCFQVSNCYAYNNGRYGFNENNNISSSYAYQNTDSGFYKCYEISANYSYSNSGSGFEQCYEISASRATSNSVDGFLDSENITSCKSVVNTGNGFNGCKAMGFNYSTANGTNYNNCFADRAGLNAVDDTAAGGYNG
jgi:hypothetical protein